MSEADGFIGSLLYAAPEQLADSSDQVSPAWDLYALGVILHELLTGEHPLSTDRDVGAVQVTGFFECLVGALRAECAADRPESAQAVLEILDQAEAGAWWEQRRQSFVSSLSECPPRLSVSANGQFARYCPNCLTFVSEGPFCCP